MSNFVYRLLSIKFLTKIFKQDLVLKFLCKISCKIIFLYLQIKFLKIWFEVNFTKSPLFACKKVEVHRITLNSRVIYRIFKKLYNSKYIRSIKTDDTEKMHKLTKLLAHTTKAPRVRP